MASKHACKCNISTQGIKKEAKGEPKKVSIQTMLFYLCCTGVLSNVGDYKKNTWYELSVPNLLTAERQRKTVI